MPPPLLVDLTQIDLDRVLVTHDQIYRQHLPHRYEFMLLSGVCALDPDRGSIVAFADLHDDAWWVRGHVPDCPLLPGVLMLELAAHASAVGACLLHQHRGFIAFGGVDRCKFREPIFPPARLYLLCVEKDYRQRRIVSQTQGVVDGQMVFEAEITGMTRL